MCQAHNMACYSLPVEMLPQSKNLQPKKASCKPPNLKEFAVLSIVILVAFLPGQATASVVRSRVHQDLTELCCTTEISGRSSDHAILAQSADRTLARLYKTSVYNQMLTETYCMSLVERDLHVTVHPRCVGHCRQVKEAENAIVIDEHGDLHIKQVLVNSGCVFVPL